MGIRMRVGDKYQCNRLGLVVIVRVHSFGTYDVVTANGMYYRISGLS